MKCLDALMFITLTSVVSMVLVILYLHQAAARDIFIVAIPTLVIFTVVVLVYKQRRQRSELDVSGHQETDDVESGNGTSGDEENNNMDAPPVYETVVSKPPPYEYLYVSACGDDPPPSSAVPSSAATPETDGVLRQGEGPNATEQGCPDPDLPSYADIVGNPASPE
ncbi:uncharacterized protein [Panulirus ornatus]|uniref:uncharacterized protein isoform X3 n=1 Tax=Panulirus ornatus TaxID=150431 RepID=UPI003A87352B